MLLFVFRGLEVGAVISDPLFSIDRSAEGRLLWDEAGQSFRSASLELLEEAQRAARLGSYLLDLPSGRFRYSDSLRELFGFDRAERISYARYADCLHPDDRTRVIAIKERALAEGDSYSYEARFLCADGRTRHFQVRTRIEREESGKILRILGTLLDVTEQVLLRMKLEAEEARYRAIFEKSQVVMLLIDPDDGSIVDGNDAALEFYGYSREIFRQMKISQINQLGSGPVRDALDRSREKAQTFFLFPHRLASGEVRMVHAYAGPIPIGGRTLIHSIIFDVTEKLRAEEALVEKSRELERSLKVLEGAWEQTIKAMAAMSELRDPYEVGHQRRVAALAAAVACGMGWPEEEVKAVSLAGLVHDIGKIAVPSDYLSKPGPLTSRERLLVQEHSRAGYDLLRGIDIPWPLAEIVGQHHERLDGSGYPQGLRGEAILPAARILAVADVVEAMASHRPYRPAWGIEAALREIEDHRGSLFDENVVDACLLLFREKNFRLPDV